VLRLLPSRLLSLLLLLPPPPLLLLPLPLPPWPTPPLLPPPWPTPLLLPLLRLLLLLSSWRLLLLSFAQQTFEAPGDDASGAGAWHIYDACATQTLLPSSCAPHTRTCTQDEWTQTLA
jgi:hypothetical protein